MSSELLEKLVLCIFLVLWMGFLTNLENSQHSRLNDENYKFILYKYSNIAYSKFSVDYRKVKIYMVSQKKMDSWYHFRLNHNCPVDLLQPRTVQSVVVWPRQIMSKTNYKFFIVLDVKTAFHNRNQKMEQYLNKFY